MHLVISCVDVNIVPVVPTPHVTVSPSVIDPSQEVGRDANNKLGIVWQHVARCYIWETDRLNWDGSPWGLPQLPDNQK